MGEIGFPQNVIDAYIIAQLHAHRLEPEIHEDLAPEQLAGSRDQSLAPKVALLPFVIAGLEDGTHPTQAGLGEDPIEARESFQHAGENQEGNNLRRRTKIAQGGDTVRLSAGETFPTRQGQLTCEPRGGMEMNTDAELLANIP